jgi:CIC family chloride channel protein
MVSEMTGNLSLLAPSMIAVVISYYLTGSKYTIYHSQVETKADSPAHMGEYNVPLMTRIFVSEAMNKDVQSLSEDDSVQKANQLILEKRFKGIPILSREGKVAGMVTLRDVESIPREKSDTTKLSEIMTQNVISVGPNETLLDALRKMTTNEVGQLPVVDSTSGSLLGIISRTDLLRAYDKRIF